MTAGLAILKPTPPLLAVRELSVSFGGVQAVAGVSFAAHEGTVTGLIGPNGAGKSTALGAIAGAIRATRGTVELGGVDVSKLPSFRRARLGMVRTFQMHGEFGRLTVLENLLVAPPAQRGESARGVFSPRRAWRRQERDLVAEARDLLGRFGLANHEEAYASELSGGQRRLMELARALMARPRLLLLDEPMAGVNPSMRDLLGAHLRQVAAGGVGIVLVEHELRFVEDVCENVYVLAQGSVIGEGNMNALRKQAAVLDAYLAG